MPILNDRERKILSDEGEALLARWKEDRTTLRHWLFAALGAALGAALTAGFTAAATTIATKFVH